ncbi:MAG TPA: alpha/beta hydrolase [Myxococcota bacterium]|nr:alpha/beta hydrolase [Myxococcota bacterium]
MSLPAKHSTDLLAGVNRRRLQVGPGIEIAMLDWGGSRPLALLHHANGFCAGVWGVVAQTLRPFFRVVAFDARGHGDSSKPPGREAYRWECFADDLVRVAELLAGEQVDGRVALGMGHSFGGTATLTAAARRPELFERIVLVDPVLVPRGAAVPPERSEHGKRLAGAARERQQVRASREAARRAWAGRKFFANWDPRVLDLYVAEGLRDRPDGQVELKCPGEVEAAIFEQGGSLDSLAAARNLTVPALLLRARDGNFPRDFYESVAAAMRQGRVEDVAAGHLVVMERPDLVAAAALRFAREGAGAQAGQT